MIATIEGMLCKVENRTNANSGEVTPVAHVFSGDDIVRISDIVLKPDLIGSEVCILCEIKDREYEGRKYRTIKAIERG